MLLLYVNTVNVIQEKQYENINKDFNSKNTWLESIKQRKLMDTGDFARAKSKRPIERKFAEVEATLNIIETDPSINVRRISQMKNVKILILFVMVIQEKQYGNIVEDFYPRNILLENIQKWKLMDTGAFARAKAERLTEQKFAEVETIFNSIECQEAYQIV